MIKIQNVLKKLMLKEAMHIKWENPTLNKQLKHADLTLSFWYYSLCSTSLFYCILLNDGNMSCFKLKVVVHFLKIEIKLIFLLNDTPITVVALPEPVRKLRNLAKKIQETRSHRTWSKRTDRAMMWGRPLIQFYTDEE